MKNSQTSLTSKLIILTLAFALFGTMFYSFKIHQDYITNKIALVSEKKTILKELIKSKDSLEIAISQSEFYRSDLILEKQKVISLIQDLNKKDLDISTLFNFKNEVNRYKNLVIELTNEKIELKKRNKALQVEKDSTYLALGNVKKQNDKLYTLNSEIKKEIQNIEEIVSKGSKIEIVNLQTESHKILKSGELKPTDKANKADVLQISFIVVGNKIAKPCNKEYEIQIIDTKNNIVGKKFSKKYGDLVLDYCLTSYVKFKNENVKVISDLPIENLEKGTYFVNVFDNGQLTSKTSFALR